MLRNFEFIFHVELARKKLIKCSATLVVIYVGVVLGNEEDVVVASADTNVVRDAEAYEE